MLALCANGAPPRARSSRDGMPVLAIGRSYQSNDDARPLRKSDVTHRAPSGRFLFGSQSIPARETDLSAIFSHLPATFMNSHPYLAPSSSTTQSREKTGLRRPFPESIVRKMHSRPEAVADDRITAASISYWKHQLGQQPRGSVVRPTKLHLEWYVRVERKSVPVPTERLPRFFARSEASPVPCPPHLRTPLVSGYFLYTNASLRRLIFTFFHFFLISFGIRFSARPRTFELASRLVESNESHTIVQNPAKHVSFRFLDDSSLYRMSCTALDGGIIFISCHGIPAI